MRLLLIEDSIGDARMIQEFLKEEMASAQITVCPNLTNAKNYISANHVDLILLDLALPDSFGLMTLTELLDLELPNKIPIIVLTGNDDKATATEAVRMGAQDYITKGCYTPESLARAIHYSIERVRANSVIMDQQQALFLSSKLTAMGELTAFIIHEIMNPLGAILLSSEQLEEGPAEDRKHLLIGIIKRNIRRIEKIVSSMKSFMQGSGQEPFLMTSLEHLLEGVIELCAERFKKSNIPFEIQSPQHLLEFSCRKNQVLQVLVNLLNNSFDAVKNLPLKWVRLEICEGNDFVQFSVVDSGPGIPEDLIDRILDAFFTTKGKDGGTGLGLSISKRIVHEHRGSLEIDRGCPNTRFMVRLPKYQNTVESIYSPLHEMEFTRVEA